MQQLSDAKKNEIIIIYSENFAQLCKARVLLEEIEIEGIVYAECLIIEKTENVDLKNGVSRCFRHACYFTKQPEKYTSKSNSQFSKIIEHTAEVLGPNTS